MKLDLWGDCPYRPKHLFKKGVCIGCGFKKPRTVGPFSFVGNRRIGIDQKISRILDWYQGNQISFDEGRWEDLADVYGCQLHDDYAGIARRRIYPSSPLQGEKNRSSRRFSRVARLEEYYRKEWPAVVRLLETVFEKKRDKMATFGISDAYYIRMESEKFLRWF